MGQLINFLNWRKHITTYLYIATAIGLFIATQTLGQEITRNVHGLSEMVDNENKIVEAAARIPNAITMFFGQQPHT